MRVILLNMVWGSVSFGCVRCLRYMLARRVCRRQAPPEASGRNLWKGPQTYVMVRRSVHSEVAFRRRPVMAIRTVGIDIAKSVFHLVALDEKGSVVVKKKFSRPQLLVYTANLKAEVIGMEACSGAHFLTRALIAQGHNVKLMPAEYVRPYVKSNKNDF